jgi:hypothetical protein
VIVVAAAALRIVVMRYELRQQISSMIISPIEKQPFGCML